MLSPARIFFVYLFFYQFTFSLYEARQLELPDGLEILSGLAFVWLIWWWLRDDSRKRNIQWMLDLGFFLILAWIFILPYHLFKTRGFAAFIPILFFIFVLISAYAAAEIVSAVIG